jgi:membrane-associated protease RseP (regulator of RpoE activity)
MLIPCKLWGIGVEKFYIWIDAGISLFRTNINGTEYGLGWFPTGGYVKITGMLLEEGDIVKPHHFLSLSFLKRAIIILLAPFSSLFLGILFYGLAYPTLGLQSGWGFLVLLTTLLVFWGFVGYFQQNLKHPLSSILAFLITATICTGLFYLGFCAIMASTPFYEHFFRFINGDINLWTIECTLPYFFKLMGYTGIAMGIANLLPLPGMNGYLFASILYESISRKKTPERYELIGGVITTFLSLLFISWVVYHLIT